jgi:hypothetical protein
MGARAATMQPGAAVTVRFSRRDADGDCATHGCWPPDLALDVGRSAGETAASSSVL